MAAGRQRVRLRPGIARPHRPAHRRRHDGVVVAIDDDDAAVRDGQRRQVLGPQQRQHPRLEMARGDARAALGADHGLGQGQPGVAARPLIRARQAVGLEKDIAGLRDKLVPLAAAGTIARSG